MFIEYSVNTEEKKEKIRAEIDGFDDITDNQLDYRSAFGKRYGDFYDSFVIENHQFYTMCDILSLDFYSLSDELFNLNDEFKLFGDTDDAKKAEAYTNLHEEIFHILASYHKLLVDDGLRESIHQTIINTEKESTMRDCITRNADGNYKYTMFDSVHYSLYGEKNEESVISTFYPVGNLYKLLLLRKYVSETVKGNLLLANPQVFLKYANCVIGELVFNEFDEDDEKPPHLFEIDRIFNRFLAQLEKQNNGEKYWSNGVFEFINFNLYNIFSSNLAIKECLICGKLYVPYNRSDTLYCDRVSPQDPAKTCKEYGARQAYQENLKTNQSMRLYRNIYMAKQMLVKRNPDIQAYSDNFENYKAQSKQWKADVKNGLKTNDEFLAWLKSVRRKDDD